MGTCVHINREYAMLRLADENVAKNSRIMMLLISA